MDHHTPISNTARPRLLYADSEEFNCRWSRTPVRMRRLINTAFATSLLWLPLWLLIVLGVWTGDMRASLQRWRPAGLAWLVVGGGAFLAAWSIERWRALSTAIRRKHELYEVQSKQSTLRTKGDASEEMAANVIRAVVPRLDPRYWAKWGMIVRYPDPRPDQMPMFEVDNLVITRFGIFLIEVKHWSGQIDVSHDGWTLDRGSRTETKQSPLKQSEPKIRVLRKIAKEVFGERPIIKIHSLAVFTHSDAQLPLTVPPEVLQLHELRYYLRTAYLAALDTGLASHEDVQRFCDRLSAFHDARPDAKHEFMLELGRRKGNNAEYLELEHRRQQLMRISGLVQRPYWASPVMYLGLALYLAVAPFICLAEIHGAQAALPGGTDAAALPVKNGREANQRSAATTRTAHKVKRRLVQSGSGNHAPDF